MSQQWDSKWVEKLAEQARILGEARMLRDDQQLTEELSKIIITRFQEFLKRADKSMQWASRSLGISAGTLSQIISGSYEADAEQHIRNLDRWLEQQILREQAPKPAGFVLTNVASQIYGVHKWIAKRGGIGVIHGPTGSGKTMTLQAIAAETPGSIFVTIRTAGQSKLSVLQTIAGALRMGQVRLTSFQLDRQLVMALKDTNRLIIVDEIQKLAGRKNDDALHALRDLHDATKCPMIWSGMSKISSYIQNGNEEGYDPLEQIFGRVRVWLNLSEIASRADGGPGLHTIEDIQKMLRASKIRVTPDAERYLHKLANEPRLGGLRACDSLVGFAAEVAGARPIDAAMLHGILSQQLGRRQADPLMGQMESRAVAMAAG
ncbi:MAG TPA: AAA family ATPase [Tepidisphaeraceae bacterium]|jgi:DNA transposition AAA+ family ATPase